MMNVIKSDPHYQHNLEMLESRERGQKFQVKKGKLILITGIWEKICYFFNRSQIQNTVKEVISKTIRQIDSDNYGVDKTKKLFFETLKPLSLEVYDRGKICAKTLETIADSKLNEASKCLSSKINSVKLAVKLGVDFIPVEEGNNGTYFGRDRFRKIQVVFKPADEESSSENCGKLTSKIKKVLFTLFPWLKTHTNLYRENACLNEVGASLVDQHLKTNLIPETVIEEFESEQFEGAGVQNKKGSCQEFVPGMRMAQEVLGLPSFGFFGFWKRSLQKLWMYLFASIQPKVFNFSQHQKAAIIDFITGNQDGHMNNFLVNEKRVVVIDQGLSFPFEPPATPLSSINQYTWKYLAGADKVFDKDTNKVLLKQLNKTSGLFDALRKKMGEKGFTQAQEVFMQRRIDIVKQVILQGKSIEYLGSITSEDDFIRAEEELKIGSSLPNAASNLFQDSPQYS